MTIGFATRIACSLALTAGVAVPVQAHHSHGNYMMSDFTFLEGTVTELHLVNPHSWIYLEVKDAKGETTVWFSRSTVKTWLPPLASSISSSTCSGGKTTGSRPLFRQLP